jgi:hypothetical protein
LDSEFSKEEIKESILEINKATGFDGTYKMFGTVKRGIAILVENFDKS